MAIVNLSKEEMKKRGLDALEVLLTKVCAASCNSEALCRYYSEVRGFLIALRSVELLSETEYLEKIADADHTYLMACGSWLKNLS